MRDIFEWLQHGQRQGWISKQFCMTHDGPPTTSDEDDEWESGGDPCCFCVRLKEPDMQLEGGREGWGADV